MKNIIIGGKENNYYQVDRMGNVFNKDGHQMTLFKSNNGYLRVKLSVGCKRGMYLVHRLVASTYVNNPHGYPIVNHKNSVRDDNTADNLEWATNSMNQLQRFRENGFKGTKRRPVLQIEIHTGTVVRTWESAIDAHIDTGIQRSNIYKVCRGLRKAAGGYKWEYA